MHLIYTLLAMLLVGILSLSVLRTSASSEQRMVTNEIMTQVTGVADEVFDHASDYWFDERVHEGKWPIQPPIFPIITSAQLSELTAEPGEPKKALVVSPFAYQWMGNVSAAAVRRASASSAVLLAASASPAKHRTAAILRRPRRPARTHPGDESRWSDVSD